MFDSSGQADLHRILSREFEEERYEYVVSVPSEITPDTSSLVNVGAHFPARRRSPPNYPHNVELDDEDAQALHDRNDQHVQDSHDLDLSSERAFVLTQQQDHDTNADRQRPPTPTPTPGPSTPRLQQHHQHHQHHHHHLLLQTGENQYAPPSPTHMLLQRAPNLSSPEYQMLERQRSSRVERQRSRRPSELSSLSRVIDSP